MSCLLITFEYRINGGGGENNRGGWKIGGLKMVLFLANTYVLYIYVDSNVTDTFICELWCC